MGVLDKDKIPPLPEPWRRKWIGIAGGRFDYLDSQGRVWLSAAGHRYRTESWGGYTEDSPEPDFIDSSASFDDPLDGFSEDMALLKSRTTIKKDEDVSKPF